jgi:WD40 repeat protein
VPAGESSALLTTGEVPALIPSRSPNRKRQRVSLQKRQSLPSTILGRQLSSKQNLRFHAQQAPIIKFSKFDVCGECETHDPQCNAFSLPFLRQRTSIVEICAADSVIFALTKSGVCVAFDRDSQRRLCYMNIAPDEVVRSLFYNKTNASLITVSVYREDNFSSLKCRSNPLRFVTQPKPNPKEGMLRVLESESLCWPGFVEFDAVNSKMLTFSAANSIYKIWDLTSYQMLYSIAGSDDKLGKIDEIKISPNIMLIIYATCNKHVPLDVLDIGTGACRKRLRHPLHPSAQIEFIEMFNEKLLLKQVNRPLQIIDVKSDPPVVLEITTTTTLTPSAFIFLYEAELFLTFLDQNVHVWDFKGNELQKFESHQSQSNAVYITSSQDLIISMNHSTVPNISSSINVSEILTGRCLTQIKANSSDPRRMAALQDITALYYNEDRNEIIVGNKQGRLHVWGN